MARTFIFSDFIRVAHDGQRKLCLMPVVRGLRDFCISESEEGNVLVGLLQNGGETVSRVSELVVEALAFVIHENGAVTRGQLQ